MSITMVANGFAAATTATTIAAAATIGSATCLGIAALGASATSNSFSDFNDQGNWGTVAHIAVGGAIGAGSAYFSTRISTASAKINPVEKIGTSRSDKNSVPNGYYTQLDNKGNVYSRARYDIYGRQVERVDFGGKPHGGASPHIHVYTYLERGGRMEEVFDIFGNKIG